ncbi:DUF917 domain-containing protein [Algoriphagus limi]|uniref:DUF917 domain-containing protein n=1 Tax=Algoriphagus limi TaxID=2975273 RepID=A0ABT2G4Y9_9BACT|nr:DUF917 domain-containing protein [Algoriphagus limi]MCS5490340.1 DUF917 domain-containing protein [Algoriphagus limi]
MRKLGFEDLEQIILGTAFLGSGGGGMTKTGYAFLDQMKKQYPSVSLPLVEASDESLDPSSLAMVICDIGAISAIESNQGIAIKAAYDFLADHQEKYTGKKTTAVLPIELGPESTMVPFVLAAACPELVVLDGDGARRAVPQIELTTFASNNLDVAPAVITNDQPQSVLVNCEGAGVLDAMLRPIVEIENFGDSASLGMFSNPISAFEKAMIPGTITLSQMVGKMVQNLQNGVETDPQTLQQVNILQAELIGKGKVLNTLDNVDGGFDHGKTLIADTETHKLYTILNQNENLIVFSSDETAPLAIAPDLICVITKEFKVVTNGEISSVDELFIIRVQAPEQMQNQGIVKGFQELINEMGYAGSMTVPPQKLIGLGDLFNQLADLIKKNYS